MVEKTDSSTDQLIDLDSLIAEILTPVENEGDAYYKVYIDNLPLAAFTYKISLEGEFTKSDTNQTTYLFRIPRCADILDNIQFNSVYPYTLKYIIDGVESPDNIETYACFAAFGTHDSIKITFLEELLDENTVDDFSFTVRAMILNKTIQDELLTKHVFTKHLSYDEGKAHLK